MRALVQRVSEGSVSVKENNYFAGISQGMVLLLGIKDDDKESDISFVADKCSNLRIFEDNEGKMNLSLNDIMGEVLIISQFTLYGDARKGNRPNFTQAARPEKAEEYYRLFIERMQQNLGPERIKTGIFGAMMQVSILNDGPVTILVESK
ncbi:MAG: D-aminoacyl-tRNA deacylase [Methanococcaceae archaeon]